MYCNNEINTLFFLASVNNNFVCFITDDNMKKYFTNNIIKEFEDKALLNLKIKRYYILFLNLLDEIVNNLSKKYIENINNNNTLKNNTSENNIIKNNSNNSIFNKTNEENMKSINNTDINQQKNLKEKENKNLYIFLLIVLIIFIIVAVYFIFYSYKLKNRMDLMSDIGTNYINLTSKKIELNKIKD